MAGLVGRPLGSLACVILIACAGCVQESQPPATTSVTPSSADASGPSPTPTTGATAAPTQADLAATPVAGTAPLKVNFTLSNSGKGTATNWTLAYGDGNRTNGTTLPAPATYTYTKAGNYTALLVVQGTDGSRSNASALVTVAAAKSAAPSKTTYTAGTTLGCLSEAGYGKCGAVVRGTSDGLFGLWIKLEPAHLGMTFTTKGGLNGDSDAWAFDDPTKAPLTDDLAAGGKEATGVVPATAKWLLVYSWAGPSTGLTVTFR